MDEGSSHGPGKTLVFYFAIFDVLISLNATTIHSDGNTYNSGNNHFFHVHPDGWIFS